MVKKYKIATKDHKVTIKKSKVMFKIKINLKIVKKSKFREMEHAISMHELEIRNYVNQNKVLAYKVDVLSKVNVKQADIIEKQKIEIESLIRPRDAKGRYAKKDKPNETEN